MVLAPPASRLARLATAVIAVVLAASSAMVADGVARASAQDRPTVTTSLSIPGELDAVAATSPTNAWAVGYLENRNPDKPDTLIIVHWDGVRWTRMTVPHFPYGRLYAVAAVSKNDAWAVGWNESPVSGYLEPPSALVLHWNGTVWRPVSSLFDSDFTPVALSATATEVWAAGNAGGIEFLHYVGGRWYFVPVAQSVNSGSPASLVMSGPKSGWLAGTAEPANSSDYTAFTLHWNGTAWKRVTAKVHDAFSQLNALAGLPGGAVWAVGREAIDPNNYNTYGPLSLRWSGKAWLQVPVDIPGAVEFDGVAHIPGSTAWAVGTMANNLISGALVARWTGTAWKLAPSPGADWADALFAVSATSASDAWAVGEINTPAGSATFMTVILHWNGTTWS